jgi:hypothetical protein
VAAPPPYSNNYVEKTTYEQKGTVEERKEKERWRGICGGEGIARIT